MLITLTQPWERQIMVPIRTFLRTALLVMCFAFTFPACAQEPALLLFGGPDHDKFLGCLNCGRYGTSSIWNEYGTYGSPYNSDSIWNRYGTWGSPYNTASPWNKYSNQAPAIVDKDGHFYGYFSANQYIPNRTKIQWLVWLLDNYDYVVDHLDEVREKVN